MTFNADNLIFFYFILAMIGLSIALLLLIQPGRRNNITTRHNRNARR